MSTETDIRDSVCSDLLMFIEEAKELGIKQDYDRDKKTLEEILEFDCIKIARPSLYSEYKEKLSKITFQ